MVLFILTETSAGYAILKSKDKKLLKDDNIAARTSSVADTCDLLKLKHFSKFESASAALAEAAALTEGKVTPTLSRILEEIKDEKKASLAVADPKLANAIKKLPQLQIVPVSDKQTDEVFRAIREYLPSLIPDLLPEELATMSLGLSHSLSRYKLKFSPDKVDTMIIQAIALLDDLDKELNIYAMRVKEWYGWHFPEMAKIINDNLAYAKVILAMGVRSNAADTDLSDILPEEIEGAVKAAAEISMGTEITDLDLVNIQALAEQVVGFTEYRSQLSSYLTSRMQAIAPNLTALVGELVGARLIAHSGSLMNLAKSPASTIQILGAEKALFRALKTKHDTPKYGLIYHASLIGQATGKNKGKIARVLATKTALGLRVDALSDWGAGGEGEKPEPSEEEKTAVGVSGRLMVERRLRHLEGKPLKREGVAIGPFGQQTQPGKWSIKEARKYNADADGLAADEPIKKPANGVKSPLISEIESKDVDMKDEDEDSADEDAKVNGEKELSKAERKALKAARKEAKAQRKLERAEKRAKKEAKRAGTTNGSTGLTNGNSKKRKAEEVDGDVSKEKEKKKKKKKSSEDA